MLLPFVAIAPSATFLIHPLMLLGSLLTTIDAYAEVVAPRLNWLRRGRAWHASLATPIREHF